MRVLFILLISCFLISDQASAITVNLTAKIDELDQNYFEKDVFGYFDVGDEIHISFTYTPDDSAYAGDANGFKYLVTEFTITTEKYSTAIFNRGAIKLTNGMNNESQDTFEMYSGIEDLTQGFGEPLPGVALLDGCYLSSFGLTLESSHKNVFKTDSLDQDFSFNDFDIFYLYFDFREQFTTRAMGTLHSRTLTSLSSSKPSISPTPEPSTILLFGTGLAGIAAIGRRKRN